MRKGMQKERRREEETDGRGEGGEGRKLDEGRGWRRDVEG